jgi:hypothetical protein
MDCSLTRSTFFSYQLLLRHLSNGEKPIKIAAVEGKYFVYRFKAVSLSNLLAQPKKRVHAIERINVAVSMGFHPQSQHTIPFKRLNTMKHFPGKQTEKKKRKNTFNLRVA